MPKKPPKPKAINFELIPPVDGDHIPEPYRILQEMRDKHHSDLHYAKIALAWRKSLKADKDGHLMLGKCVKASDLQREFAAYDFVILLNRDIWQMDFSLPKKKALIDHELCHAAQVLDKYGEQKYDERGRAIYRMRHHDIEEFREIVQRHGCYKKDLERFAEALLRSHDMPLLDAMNKAPVSVVSIADAIAEKLPEINAELQANAPEGTRVTLSLEPDAPAPLVETPIQESAKAAVTHGSNGKRKRGAPKTDPQTQGEGVYPV